MKKIILLLGISSFFFLTACNNEGQADKAADTEKEKQEQVSQDKWDVAYKEVMGIHDEVMPRMGEINRLKRTIQEKLETGQGKMGTELEKTMNTAVAKLEAADSLMMAWMATFNDGYKKVKKKAQDQEVMEYLEKEKEKITIVKDRMLESIRLGKVLTEGEAE
jgi:hypothetical protein